MAATFRAGLWLLLFAFGPTATAQDPRGAGSAVQLEPPRSFGYRIGDTLHVAGVIEVPAGFELEGARGARGGLPSWLELRDESWELRDEDDGRAYRFRLVFQLFYAPDSVTRLALPEWHVEFREVASGERLETALPELTVTIAPVTRGLGPVAADYVVPAPSPRPILLAGGVLAVLLTWLGIDLVLRRRRGSGRFRTAHRQIERTRDCVEGTLVLHRALEEKMGGAVFRSDLDRLVRRWPAAEMVREDLGRFFELSETIFYRDGNARTPPDCLDRVRELSRQLMVLERRADRRDPDREESRWNSLDPGS